MKKLLLSFVAAAVGILSANADSYTIQFKADPDSNNQGSAIGQNTTLADVISDGVEFVTSFSDFTQAYQACNSGLKIGANKQAGNLTINLSDLGAVNASKIEVYASASKNPSYQKLNVNGTEFSFESNETNNNFKVCAIEPGKVVDAIVLKKTNASSTSSQQGFIFVNKIVVTYEAQAGDKQPAGLSYSATSVEVNANALDKFEAPTLSNPNNLAVTYTSSDENVADVNAEGVVTLTGDEGVTVIKAEFAGDDTYNQGSASYTITVKNIPVNESSEANPYSVAQALAIAKSLDASTEIADVYAKGYVIAITEVSTNFGNATYTIGDAADATEGLSVYRGLYLNGDKFTSTDQLSVGAEVVVCGTLVNYKGNTPQFKAGSKIISYNYEGGDTPEITAIKNINEAFALEAGTKVTVDFPLTVAFVNGNNILLCDEAGDFIQIYSKNTLKVGDVLPGGWEATYTVRYDVPQFTPAAALPAATEGTFEPKVVAAADVTPAIVNHVVVVEDVVFDAATPAAAENFEGKVGDVTLNFRNNYNLASVEPGTYNVTFWVNLYNGATSLYVINYAKKTTTGIEEVAVDQEADAVYYNLQGVRVENPANGVYLRVVGSKVSKVSVR